MRSRSFIVFVFLLLSACGVVEQPTSSVPAPQSAQTNAYPTPIAAPAPPAPSPELATTTSVPPTVIATTVLSTQVPVIELSQDPPAWATWHLETTFVLTSTDTNLQLWGWSHDGTRLLFTDNKNLKILTMTNQDIITIPQFVESATWSPTSNTMLAYVAHNPTSPKPETTLWIYNVDTQIATPVNEFPQRLNQGKIDVRWTLDNKITVATDQHIFIFDPQDAKNKKDVWNHPTTEKHSPSIRLSPNGTYGLRTTEPKKAPLIDHPINLEWIKNGKVTVALSVTNPYPNVVWSNDSSLIAINNHIRDILVVDMSGKIKQNVTIHGNNPLPLAWSPDNQYLVYSFNYGGTNSPYNAYITQLNGAGSVILNESILREDQQIAGGISDVVWSPNNDVIAYIETIYYGLQDKEDTGSLVIRRIVR